MTTTVNEPDNPYKDLPHLRVLHCLTCGTLDEIPDYEGRPSEDAELNYVVDKHDHGSHKGMLYRVPIGFWLQEPIKRQIIEQIKGGGSKGLGEVDPSYYDTRNTFQDDAMACYSAHLRPKEGCPDFHSEKKVLLPDTKAERKEAGLPIRPTGPKRYLCDFCPVRMHVERKVRGE